MTGVIGETIRHQVIERVLIEADVAGQVERALREREPVILGVLPMVVSEIARHLGDKPADLWSEPVRRLALSIAIGREETRAA